MSNFSAFDIIGPQMIGPSSSHTAGAARIGNMARKLANNDVVKAEITLYGSFAASSAGHGTDKALVAGILGMNPDNERLRFSMLLAQEADIGISFCVSDEDPPHPNTARIILTSSDGTVTEMMGCSVGGGNVEVVELNGGRIRFTGEYPTLIVLHDDVPGAINGVTGILAHEHINIEYMRVFKRNDFSTSYMVIETDVSIQERTIALIKDWCPYVKEVRVI